MADQEKTHGSDEKGKSISRGSDSLSLEGTSDSAVVRHTNNPYDDESENINEMILDSQWREAVRIDDQLYWLEPDGKTTGAPVLKDRKWNMRSSGCSILLAPKEELPDDDFTDIMSISDLAAKREAFMEKLLDEVVKLALAEDASIPQEIYQGSTSTLEETAVELRRQHLKADMRRRFRMAPVETADPADPDTWFQIEANPNYDNDSTKDEDGFIAVDTDGNLDIDHDNPGPTLKRQTQFISRGYLSLKVEDSVDKVTRRATKKAAALMSSGSTEGYESSSSEVSLAHCHTTPQYPDCDSACWLKGQIVRRAPPPAPERRPISGGLPVPSSRAYRSLPKGYMRVLVLDAGSEEEPISCHLEDVEIPGATPPISEPVEVHAQGYEALSYCWGSSTRTHIITCNNQEFPVTTSLFEALVHLRLTDKPRVIWADAICINQDDVTERNEQVRHMLRIYQAAHRVVVWLGGIAEDGDLAMQAINYLGSRDNRRAIVRKHHETECLDQLHKVISVLQRFFRRPWFSRCWIRQEISAAKHVVVQCGTAQASWGALKRTNNCMWKLREKLIAQGHANSLDEPGELGPHSSLTLLKRHWVLGQNICYDLGDIRSVWYYHTGGLLDLLMSNRFFDSTDPRDKVYSILGLAQVPIKGSKEPTSSTPQENSIRIDYAATISSVYQSVAKFIINRDQNLDILCVLCKPPGNAGADDLPSWTPDWRTPAPGLDLSTNSDYLTTKWGASGFTKAIHQVEQDLGRLVVQGFPIGKVTKLHSLTGTSLPHPPERLTGKMEIFDPEKHVRRFAETEQGSGMVPAWAGVGDELWILFGCKMPILLRRDLQTAQTTLHTVLGPCYIPKVMYGEALEEEQRVRYANTRTINLV